MSTLPDRRTPDRSDWERVAASWRPRLDEQIALLERLRDRLTGMHRLRLPVTRSVPTGQPRRPPRRRRIRPAPPAARLSARAGRARPWGDSALPTTGAPARRATSACGKRRHPVACGAPVVAAGHSVAAEPTGPEVALAGTLTWTSLSALASPAHHPGDRNAIGRTDDPDVVLPADPGPMRTSRLTTPAGDP